jgi:hypothetical protein
VNVDLFAFGVAPARIIRVNLEATTSLTQGGTDTAVRYPAAVARIEPSTGALTFSVPLGGAVVAIATSSDGSSLYAGIDSRNEVVRLSLPDLKVQQRIMLPIGTSVRSIAVSPADPSTFAWRGNGFAPGPYLVRAGIQQPRSPIGGITTTLREDSMVFSSDGSRLFVLGDSLTQSGLLSLPVQADGFLASVLSSPEPTFGGPVTRVDNNLLVGVNLLRGSDLSLIGGASVSVASRCMQLRASTRWICSAQTVGSSLAVAVIDAANGYRLVEDGNINLVSPLPDGVGDRTRSIPGPPGQVAVVLTASDASREGWLALFDNPDFR